MGPFLVPKMVLAERFFLETVLQKMSDTVQGQGPSQGPNRVRASETLTPHTSSVYM